MYHCLFALGMSLLWLPASYSQSASTLMGARAGGLGYASSCVQDEWSIFNNVAGLAEVKKISASVTYDALPSFKSFNRVAATFTLPVKFGVASVGIFRFGDEMYNEQIASLGFSNTFGLASLGLKLNYIQYNAEGFGTKGFISVSFGGIAQLTEKIFIGAHIINLNQPDISSAGDEKLPTILIVGTAFRLTPQTFITTELEKDLHFPVKWKAGAEYQFYKKFLCRTGFHINPSTAFFGFGFHPGKFKLDYVYQHNFTTGSRHQATVGYFLSSDK